MRSRVGQIWKFDEDLFVVVDDPCNVDEGGDFCEHALVSLTTGERRWGLEFRHKPWESEWERVE